MKRTIAAGLCAVLLLFSLSVASVAEPNELLTGETTAPLTGTTTDTDSTGGTTAPITTPTGKAEYDFDFTVQGDKLIVTWNSEAFPGVSVKYVTIGTTNITVNVPDSSFEVSLLNFDPGEYKVSFVLSNNSWIESDKLLELEGTINTTLKIAVENNKIVATITDEKGAPIKDYPIKLLMGGGEVEKQNTNAQGRATFTFAPPSDLKSVMCVAENLTVGCVTYIGATRAFGDEPTTVPTTDPTTEPSTEPSTEPTTGPTTSVPPTTPTTTRPPTTLPPTTPGGTTTTLYWGSGTTANVNNRVAISLGFDRATLVAFGVKQDTLQTQGRLLVTPEVYTRLVDTSPLQLSLLLQAGNLKLTSDQVATLVADSDQYDLSSTVFLPLQSTLTLWDAASGNYTSLSADMGTVVVELPVPSSMTGKTVMVAVLDPAGILSTVPVTVEGGVISFETKSASTFLLMGLTSKAAESSFSWTRFVLIALIVLGVLILGGIGFLVYFFFIRKTDDEEEETAGTASTNQENAAVPLVDEDDFTAVFSETVPHTPSKSSETTTAQKQPIEPVEGISLGQLNDTTELTTSAKDTKNYDIEL